MYISCTGINLECCSTHFETSEHIYLLRHGFITLTQQCVAHSKKEGEKLRSEILESIL
jgi:hypothetical protein